MRKQFLIFGISLLRLSLSKGRIIGGTPATDGEYPFYVHTIDGCGGTLIYKDIVLTAAHCAPAFTVGKTVYIGAVDIDGTGDETNTVKQLYPHPNYNMNGQEENDIMLLKLESFSSSPPVLLNKNPSIPLSGSQIDVIGFGTTSEGGSSSTTLLEVQLTVKDFEICSTNLGGDQYEATQVCAGDTGKDSCQGDSGGPLLVAGSNVQVAIVSYGEGCGRENLPGINTRVSAYIDFIDEGICNLSDDPPKRCGCSRLICCDLFH